MVSESRIRGIGCRGVGHSSLNICKIKRYRYIYTCVSSGPRQCHPWLGVRIDKLDSRSVCEYRMASCRCRFGICLVSSEFPLEVECPLFNEEDWQYIVMALRCGSPLSYW